MYVIIGLLCVFSVCANLQSPAHVRRAIERDRSDRRRQPAKEADDGRLGHEAKDDEATRLGIDLRYEP